MNFIDYCIATKNYSALDSVEEYTKQFGLFDGLKDAYRSAKRAGYKGVGDMLLNLRGVSKAVKERREKRDKLKELRKGMTGNEDLKNLMSNYLYRSNGKGGSYEIGDRDINKLLKIGNETIKNARIDEGMKHGYGIGREAGWDMGLGYGLKEGKRQAFEKVAADAKRKKGQKKDYVDPLTIPLKDRLTDEAKYKIADMEKKKKGWDDARAASSKTKLSIKKPKTYDDYNWYAE